MRCKISCRASLVLVFLQGWLRVSAANVMNYGADGNDYFQFTTPSIGFDKSSGFTTLITFAMHVDADGTLEIGGGPVCSNGVYLGPANWATLINTLKTPPTTVTRYEVCIGGWLDTSYDNIQSLVASQGSGPSSILYRNFQALKNAVPGIDAINDDDEKTYDLSSTVILANLLGGLGYKFTTAPYTVQGFWVVLNNSITNCDYIYLQCYEGGAGNDPLQWNNAFGHGVVVIPGQESNTASEANTRNWHAQTGVQGGFYYPDVVFNATFWSAAIYEGCGIAPTVPMGVIANPGGGQAILSWSTAPGATSYNVKRSTTSGGEIKIATVSATTNNWPTSNEYVDTGLVSGTAYYYKVSAVNSNGISLDSAEVSATPQTGISNNFSFEADFAAPGGAVNAVPTGWSAFNEGRSDFIGSENAGGTDYTHSNPLAATAEGNQFCWINSFVTGSGGTTGVPEGIYQDVGTLQTNTIYTLTVAIGSRNDRINSPGIISLVNGTNNAGTVLATAGGLPSTQNTWRDYSVTFTTGTSVSGDLTIVLSALGSGTIQADFDNVRLTSARVPTTPPPTAITINNFSFEQNVASPGTAVSAVSGWSVFNQTLGNIGSQRAGLSGGGKADYTVFAPLAVPANASQYCYINMFDGNPTGGIYQDVGALEANTVYTLTVAIGSRNDRINSPGMISLLNGNNNTGTVLAQGGGLPPVTNSWQDYSITYVTGASASGDLTVALSAVGSGTIQADFDNVRLTKAPITFSVPTLGAPRVLNGNLILSGTGGVPNGNYTCLETTNLAAPTNWTTNNTGTFDGNGVFSNAVPIDPSQPASFFRLRLP